MHSLFIKKFKVPEVAVDYLKVFFKPLEIDFVEKMDKEGAKQVVIDAHEAGLMHTANPNGICNCCGDCCYVLRSQQRRKSIGVWPPSKYVIEFDESKCIGCGKCAKRCHFGVFEIKEGKVTVDESKCIGCGICNSTCKKNALTMKERK